MPTIDLVVSIPVKRSFRVDQCASIFDVDVMDKMSHRWQLELPIDDDDWSIGLIIGPSGSGKSSVARHVFGKCVFEDFRWSKTQSILDDFPKDVETKEIIQTLTSVGFSSPPSWVKPFHVLSTGEKFRVSMARAIMESKDEECCVVDEFTSVVDRIVAKIGSVAVAKTMRRKKRRFVAVSCHYDIARWLEPDWVLDMKTQRFTRRRLRRPEIRLKVYRCERGLWPMFERYHYLSAKLHRASETYVGCVDGQETSFVALLSSCGHKGRKRVHRFVVLPDYQGVGIGRATLNAVGSLCIDRKLKLGIVSSHPAVIHGLGRDGHWKCTTYHKNGTRPHSKIDKGMNGRFGTKMASFDFIG